MRGDPMNREEAARLGKGFWLHGYSVRSEFIQKMELFHSDSSLARRKRLSLFNDRVRQFRWECVCYCSLKSKHHDGIDVYIQLILRE